MIAIYCRKSVYSDNSDSVKNQEQMCQDFIRMRFSDDVETITFTDEGYTGANTSRPHLARLIADIKAEKVDTLVVYQLDRLSRSVKDFADIYDLMEKHHVTFLSVKEHLDTSSPIGKAMIYIIMVFAQMEREQIAQRVTDNLQGLAKSGLWVGGNPPVGYRREKTVIDGKKHTVIVPDSPEYVRKIFDDFLSNDYSLQRMETAYKHAGIKTHTGSFFSTSQLYKILTCPYYVEATPEVYDHFFNKGCRMIDNRDKWDGSHGVMVYGRTTERNKKHQLQPPTEWMVCCGIHEPIIDAETFLKAQKQLKSNSFSRHGKYAPPLLKGIVRCKECGCLMQIGRKHYSKSMSSYYYCITRSRKGTCTMSQIRTDKLDRLVLDAFKQIAVDESAIEKYLPKHEQVKDDSKKIEKKIAQTEKKINNLVSALEDASPSVQKRLVSSINDLDREISELNRKLQICRESVRDSADYDIKKQSIKEMVQHLDELPPEALNSFARSVISECTFDGKELFLRL